jgi:hypothetical protein
MAMLMGGGRPRRIRIQTLAAEPDPSDEANWCASLTRHRSFVQ